MCNFQITSETDQNIKRQENNLNKLDSLKKNRDSD